jgi:hypothetical protein
MQQRTTSRPQTFGLSNQAKTIRRSDLQQLTEFVELERPDIPQNAPSAPESGRELGARVRRDTSLSHRVASR